MIQIVSRLVQTLLQGLCLESHEAELKLIEPFAATVAHPPTQLPAKYEHITSNQV